MPKPLASLLIGLSLLGACNKKRDNTAATGDYARSEYVAPAVNQAPAQGSGSSAMAGSAAMPMTPAPAVDPGAFIDYGKNPWVDASRDHLSTFAADVDTAAYTVARRALVEGHLPVPAGVRVEELVNYFRYRMPAPAGDSPFAAVLDAAPSPLAPGRDILRVAVGTQAKTASERKPARLVFLVDVSGSMGAPDRIGLAKESLKILTRNLTDKDSVAIVTYAGNSRVVLPPTSATHKPDILDAIDGLQIGGGTAMASGIDLAYDAAAAGLADGVTSRVIVLTDGDANVGAHTHEEILKIIADRARAGVTLSTIGFGTGNYKDGMLEQLADKGNGNAFYVDGMAAATKIFAEQLGENLEVVARDVKLQVDFDPALVSRYRLVGYENRDVADSDFRNDQVDAGEVGPGHQVTAMYEIERTAAGKAAAGSPFATLHVRWRAPEGKSQKATEAAFAMSAPAAKLDGAGDDLRFAFAVAAFADVLRGGQDAEHWSLAQIRDLARGAAGEDKDRVELVGLIEKAMTITGRTATR